MPYKKKGKCVYKKDTGKKVGCTDGPVDDYLAALHANTTDESIEEESIMEVKRSRLKQIIKEEMEYVNRLFEGNLADQVYEDSTGRRGTVLSQTLCENGTATHYDVEFDDEIKLNLPAEELTVITEKIQENFLSSLFGKDKSSRRSKEGRAVGNVRNLEKELDDVELTRGATSLPWLPNIPRKHEFEEMFL